MKKTALLLALLVAQGMVHRAYGHEVVEISQTDKEVVSMELEREAQSGRYDERTSQHLMRVADAFKESQDSTEVELSEEGAIEARNEDCVNCQSRTRKGGNILARIGRAVGKGAAWVATTTAKPFMCVSGFVTGLIEKEEKNQDIVALYKFFLNHQEEFDNLYLEAGTPEEMIDLMLGKMEEIMQKKSETIMKDFLRHIGITKEITSFDEFELTSEDIANIDRSKIDVAFINNHPEYQEVKPLIGEMTQQELMDIVSSGYFDKSISFENYKEALPKPAEVVGTIVGQMFAPRIALGIISKGLAGHYTGVTLLADIGTGVSTAVCLQQSTKSKFETDQELKNFCSYVTNRTAYQLAKSRAKGYVAGKNARAGINRRLQERRDRRAQRDQSEVPEREIQQEEVEQEDEVEAIIAPTLAEETQSVEREERTNRRELFYGMRGPSNR